MGTLSILNVGAGDIKLTFDHANAAEAIRAKRMLQDMIRRGYALLVEVDGKYQRALSFDSTVGEYLIADFDPNHVHLGTIAEELVFHEPIRPETPEAAPENTPLPETQTPADSRKRGRATKRVPMERANAVAIGRSAGG